MQEPQAEHQLRAEANNIVSDLRNYIRFFKDPEINLMRARVKTHPDPVRLVEILKEIRSACDNYAEPKVLEKLEEELHGPTQSTVAPQPHLPISYSSTLPMLR